MQTLWETLFDENAIEDVIVTLREAQTVADRLCGGMPRKELTALCAVKLATAQTKISSLIKRIEA